MPQQAWQRPCWRRGSLGRTSTGRVLGRLARGTVTKMAHQQWVSRPLVFPFAGTKEDSRTYQQEERSLICIAARAAAVLWWGDGMTWQFTDGSLMVVVHAQPSAPPQKPQLEQIVDCGMSSSSTSALIIYRVFLLNDVSGTIIYIDWYASPLQLEFGTTATWSSSSQIIHNAWEKRK